ncbi:endochitinase-like [Diospyros lotus]|uniref:endochitinase-like n=1 Tax=Diospyros lotus TaxID=55363 RepID=UPI00225480FC|nr:endochitinase-like [Diospyros lotus]
MKISALVFLALATLSIIPAQDLSNGVGDVCSIITSDLFDQMLKHRNDDTCPSKGFYTYDGFIAAARSCNGFGTTGNDDTRKRELAAFFAQTSYITIGGNWQAGNASDGQFAWGYCVVRVGGHHPPPYCTSPDWPCPPSKSYYGRGPVLLTHNYNYGMAGQAIGVDLINNPDLVETDTTTSFKTAIWFWVTPQGGKPSPHDVMTGRWTPSADDISAGRLPGFGLVTNIFSSWACGRGEPVEDHWIGFYKRYCDILGVSYGDNLDCDNQKPYA